MSCTIVHLLEKEVPNGAYSMLDELHWAIKTYHPEVKQKVLICGNTKINPDFHLEREHVSRSTLLKKCAKTDNAVVIFHKLMRSEVGNYSNILLGKIPFIVVNHTFTKNVYGMSRCDALVSVSKFMWKRFNTKLFPDLRNEFIRNGVNQCRYEPIKARVDIYDSDTFLTGRINAFNRHKYSSRFMEWLSKTEWPKPLVHEYIGNGEFLRPARRLAKNLSRNSNNRIRIPGPIYSFERKIAILKSWELFIYAINAHEGTSMSILESLACGVPVICSSHYGNREIIKDGINGYVFKKKDWATATKIVTNLINNPLELAEIKRTTKQDFIDHLDARHMAKSYVDLAMDVAEKFSR